MKIQFKEYLIDYDFKMTVNYSTHSEPFENHSHKDFYEIVFVISGSAIHWVGNERQTINHGDIFLIPPAMEHGYPEVKDLKIYNILFSKSFLKYFQYDLKNSAIYNLLFSSLNQKEQRIPHLLTLEKSHFLEIDLLANEIVRNDYQERVHVGLDFFDATINRLVAWTVGTRNTQKAFCKALLEPVAYLKNLEKNANFSERLALTEELKSMPFSAIWDYYCLQNNVPVSFDYFAEIQKYEDEVLSKR